MEFSIVTMRRMLIGCFFAGALASAACSDGRAFPTSPSASAYATDAVATAPNRAEASGLADAASRPASSPRSGDVHVTKECSGYTGAAGSFCTITSSNVKGIEIGSKILYLQPDQLFSSLGSDVILDPPGPGNNTAFGHCSLALGRCAFSGGTGKFTWFHASVAVSPLGGPDFAWNGTYNFSPHD